MFCPVRFAMALPIVLGAILVGSAGNGQPPAGKKGDEIPPDPSGAFNIPPAPGGEHLEPIKPYYTAFPDLRPPAETKEVKTPDGTRRMVNVGVDDVPLPPLPVLGADAPALKKVQLEQLKAGLRYRLRIRDEVIRAGCWTSQFFLDYLFMSTETYRVAAELEDKPAARVPWFEARVRTFKEFERFTGIRVVNGSDPPQRFDQVQFKRFQAEAELIRLKAEVEKAGGAPVPPLRMSEPVNPFPKEEPNGNDAPPGRPGSDGIRPPRGAGPELALLKPTYTAFPDLLPVEAKLVKDPDGTTRLVTVDGGEVPLPPLPVLGADAPALKKVQLEQLKAGLKYTDRLKEVIRIGSWTSQFFLDALVMFAETYRVAAELEEKPAARVPWFEARVRTLKEFERFTYNRVLEGKDPPQRLDQAQFARFQAESDLIRLKAEVEKASGAPAPPRRMSEPVNPFPKENVPPRPMNELVPKPYYTAFPDLRPPVETKEVKNPDGTTRLVTVEVSDVPLPPLPVLGAGASALKKVQLEQLKAGLRYRARIREVIRIGSWTSQFFLDALVMSAETYQVATELEEKPAARVPWFEARVRASKELERMLSMRITSGSDPSPRIDQARFARLQAEADLIRLKAEVANAGK